MRPISLKNYMRRALIIIAAAFLFGAGACAVVGQDPIDGGDGDSCADGSCSTSCPGGQQACGTSCSDTAVDALNCGSCGNVCATGKSCVAGQCACVAGLTDCGGTCVDTSTDGTHCGSCNVGCGTQLCSSGVCSDSCGIGQTACGNGCVDLSTDEFDCGACGTACSAGQTCEGGQCGCPVGLSNCGGQCVDRRGNGSNCGACGIMCSADQSCVEGACTGGSVGGVGGSAGVGGDGSGVGGSTLGVGGSSFGTGGAVGIGGASSGGSTFGIGGASSGGSTFGIGGASSGGSTFGIGGASSGGAGSGGAGSGGAGSGGSGGVVPSTCGEANKQVCSNGTGTHCGYTYEYWKDQGSGCLNNTADGFSVDWSNINNLLGRKGIRPGSKNQIVTYDADYQPNGNSYLCVYGWTKGPLVEYYIVDSWGSWRPPGGEGSKMATVQSDGGTYDIYQTQRVNQPSIEGTTTFYQFWSVRTVKRESGTITVANHFNAWAALGMNMGSMYEVSMTVEGYQSSGQATVRFSME